MKKFVDGLKKLDDLVIQFEVQKMEDSVLNQRHAEMAGIYNQMSSLETSVKKSLVMIKMLLKEYGQKTKEHLLEYHDF